MGKRVLQIVILAILCVCCAVGFAACEDNGNVSGGDETHTHVYDNIVITKQSTCVEEGELTATCSCGATYTAKVPVLGHDYKAEIIAPTCTEQGYTKHTCTRCTDTYKDNYVEKLEHDYEWTTTKAPTETEEGTKTGVCKLCGDTITETIPKLNHKHSYIITIIEPTCTKNGYTLHQCACGDEFKDNETPATEHDYQTGTTAPTCTEQGYTTYTCTRCGNSYIDDYMDAFGHDYGWTTTKEPTETEQGEKQGVCTVCGDTIIQSIPTLNHQHNYIITVIEPTCTAGGYTLHKCTCGDEYITDETGALEHNFVKSGTPTGDCALSMKQYYICTRCNEIDAQAVNVQAPDTHNHLNEGDTCEYCGWSVYTKNGDSVLMKNSQDKLSAEFYGTGTYNFGGNLRQYYINAYLSNSVTSIVESTFYNCWILTSIKIPDSVTSIGNRAFYDCSSLTSITIPNSVTNILESTFSGCRNLTSITIPDSVTSIGDGAFYYCSSLTSITIGGGVKNIGSQAFSYCSSLISITIPDSVTSIGRHAFYYCSSLTSITFEENSKLISIGRYAFDGCALPFETENGLTYLQNILIGVVNTNGLPPTQYSIRKGTRVISESAFYGCSSLTSITIPDSVTSIGNSAFYGCSSLTSIIIPASVTSIGSGAFYDCTGLNNIYYVGAVDDWCAIDGLEYLFYYTATHRTLYINNEEVVSLNITTVTNISDYAFCNCLSLTIITIPDSVKSIGYHAFSGCGKLTSITFMGTIEQWQKIYKGTWWNEYVPATVVHCSDGDINI